MYMHKKHWFGKIINIRYTPINIDYVESDFVNVHFCMVSKNIIMLHTKMYECIYLVLFGILNNVVYIITNRHKI